MDRGRDDAHHHEREEEGEEEESKALSILSFKAQYITWSVVSLYLRDFVVSDIGQGKRLPSSCCGVVNQCSSSGLPMRACYGRPPLGGLFLCDVPQKRLFVSEHLVGLC